MSNPEFAGRVADIEPFRVMALLARANELASAGHDVIHMEVGEPDFPTPAPIVEAARRALDEGHTRYTAAEGELALQRAIAEFYQREFGVGISTDRIIVTAGASGALVLASALLVGPGEGILMTDPGYPCNRNFIRSFEGESQLVSVGPETNYQLDAGLVARHWRPNTKGVLLASPANPTGALISQQELDRIVEVVEQRGGVVMVDEIYNGLVYGNHVPRTALEAHNDVYVLNSFSKYFGMTGWRLGWLVVPEDAVDGAKRLAQNLYICASSIAQRAALAAFDSETRQVTETQRAAFGERRDVLVTGLRELGFGIPTTPDGAFYVYARLPDVVPCDSETFCHDLLENWFVAVTPGTDFGRFEADRHVRFSYAQSIPRLKQALERIGQALETIT